MFMLLLFLCGSSFCISLSSLSTCKITHDVEDNGLFVDCHGRGLTEIPKHFPVNSTTINLSHNEISSVMNYSFIGTPRLRSLDLSYNDVSYIDTKAFLECGSMENLNIKSNRICVNGSIFQGLGNLQELAIDDCHDADVLKPLTALTTIEIVAHQECNFEGFQYLVSLRTVVISDMFECRNDTFENLSNLKITSLTISAELSEMEINALAPLVHLQELILTGTKTGLTTPLDALYPLVGRNLSTLVIDKARNSDGSKMLMQIEDRSLTRQKMRYLCQICVSNLSLHNNFILYIDVEYIENSPIAKCLKHINLRKNMIFNIPVMAVFQLWKLTNIEYIDVSDQGKRSATSSAETDELTRYNPATDDSQVEGVLLVTLPKCLTTVIARGLSNNLDHMDFDISFRHGQRAKKIDVSFNGLSTLKHIYGGPNVEYIDISGNEELVLPDDFFCSIKMVKTLKMSSMSLRQNIADAQAEKLLSCLPRLRVLDISGNRLVQLPSDLLKLNPLLEHLDISRNIFTSIPVHLDILPNLYLLDVSSNSIGSLDKKTTDYIENHYENTKKLFHLNLNGNFFECSCVNFEFLYWLSETEVLTERNNKLSCITEDGNIIKTREITEHMLKFWRKCKGYETLTISVILGTLLLCGILTALLVDTNKTKLAYFLMNALKYQVPKQRRKDFPKDVYLSYADADYRWACHRLGAILEERNLNLFIWDRDSVPGDCTAEVITENVNQCWKTILFFTENYERDAWSYLTTMAAINCVDNLNPDRLILLLPENENPRVPECLLQVVPESCIFYVPHEVRKDDVFWDELERAIKKET